MANQTKKIVQGLVFFAAAEIFIGTITFFSVSARLVLGTSTKPPEVLIFVITTSIISAFIGIGIIKRNPHAYHLLLFFSSVIILSKVLIFTKIIALTGELETTIPASLKNTISVLYHGLVIFYFTRKPIKEEFTQQKKI